MTGRILIVDDEPNMCQLLEDAMRMRDYEPASCGSADQALQLVHDSEFDVVLTDVKMPGSTGIQLCEQVANNRPDIPVVVMTAFGSMETAISAMRAGAYDFITKPIELDLLALSVSRAMAHGQLKDQIRRLKEELHSIEPLGELIGNSEVMLKLFEQIRRVAKASTSVLITGESGSGKELVAQAIHRKSQRANGPFIAINCAALPENLLESELFGHSAGAFTGARESRKGLFVEADGGTLFLDEIGEMPQAMQSKLLRALEEQRVRPVGGNEEVAFDVRVISATNRDLELAVEEHRFREDLSFRINVIQLELPPLRARGADVLILAQHFLEHFAEKMDKPLNRISEAAADRMLAYNWPGNVRELRNVIERAVALASFDQLGEEDLPDKIRTFRQTRFLVDGQDPSQLVALEEIERRYILHVLDSVQGNKSSAARILRLDRKTLYRKLKAYGIED